jgi:hypothetical protein
MTTTANSLITPQSPLVGKCKLTAANTNYDAPTAAVQLLAGQANGARITRVQFTPAATVVGCDCQLYGYDGTSYRFIKAMAMGAQSINAGNAAAITPVDFGFSDGNPLYLAASEQLMAAVSVAQTSVHARCEGGAY